MVRDGFSGQRAGTKIVRDRFSRQGYGIKNRRDGFSGQALHKKSWAVIDRPCSLRSATVGALYERPQGIFCAKSIVDGATPHFRFRCQLLQRLPESFSFIQQHDRPLRASLSSVLGWGGAVQKMIEEINELFQPFFAPALDGMRADIRALDAKLDGKIERVDLSLGALTEKMDLFRREMLAEIKAASK